MPLAAALVGAFAISFSAIFFALAEVDPLTGAFFRMAYAIPLLVVMWWRVRDQDQRSRRERALAVGAGFMFACDVIAWHIAIGFIGAGLATLIANSQVVIVALLAWALLKERPAGMVVVAVPVVLAGVALVSGLGRADAFGNDPLRGTLLAVTSAVFYAGFLLGYRRSNRTRSPAVGALLDVTMGGALSTVLLAPLLGSIDFMPAWPSHGWLLALAAVSQVGGWLTIGYALPRLPAAETSTLIIVQPVLTMAWGALLFAERPSVLQWVGAALVLAGVGGVASFTSRRLVAAPAPG